MKRTARADGSRHDSQGGFAWEDRLAWGFLLFTILMALKAFYAAFHGGAPVNGGTNRDNITYVLLWLVLYGLSGLVVLVDSWRRGIPARLLMLAPVAVYIVASAAWSEDRAGSVVPAGMLALDVIVAAAMAALVHPRRFLLGTGITCIALVATSFLLLAVMPDVVRSDQARPGLLVNGELFGAFDTKETLGLSAGLGILIALFLRDDRLRPWMRGLAVGIGLLGLAFANSAGSVVAIGLAVATLTATRVLPRLRGVILGGAVLLAFTWSLALPFIDAKAIAGLVGRTANLTGRTDFWPMAPSFVQARPWFGYGYLSFFHDVPYSRAWDVWNRSQWFFTPEFHNSFLDTLIGLGIVGALVYASLVLAAASAAFNATLEESCSDLLGAMMIVFVIGSATEFLLLAHNAFATIVMLYCVFVAGRRYGPAAARATVRDRQALPRPSGVSGEQVLSGS